MGIWHITFFSISAKHNYINFFICFEEKTLKEQQQKSTTKTKVKTKVKYIICNVEVIMDDRETQFKFLRNVEVIGMFCLVCF